MHPLPPDSPLSVGDVLHHAAFGFATVHAVDPAGASLGWETASPLQPGWVSRSSMRDAYQACPPEGLLAGTVRDCDSVRRLLRTDGSAALGRLLVDIGPATAEEIGEWLVGRRLLPLGEAGAWWAAIEPELALDDRFLRDGERWGVRLGADFVGAVPAAAEALPPPGSCATTEALALGCGLARALCELHGRGETVGAAGRAAFTRVDGVWRCAGRPERDGARAALERREDVHALAQVLLEQVLGPLPNPRHLSAADVLPHLGELLPALPIDLFGALERALCPDPVCRPADGFALLHSLERARATHVLRDGFPHQPGATITVGFDSHIGITRALTTQVNQDCLLIAGDPDLALLVVADGISVSTAGSGDLASHILRETLRKWWTEAAASLRGASAARVHQAIREGLGRVNRQILTEAARLVGGRLSEHIPMGTTVVLAVCQGNRVQLASLGDSRAWLVDANGANLLTSDQNLQAELLRQHLGGNEPVWTEERNALTGYCGHLDHAGRPTLPPVHARSFTLLPGEWVVLTTDGFSDFADEEDAGLARVLVKAVREADDSPVPAMDVARRAVDAANAGGGGDNVTVLAFTLSAGSSRVSVGAVPNVTDAAGRAG